MTPDNCKTIQELETIFNQNCGQYFIKDFTNKIRDKNVHCLFTLHLNLALPLFHFRNNSSFLKVKVEFKHLGAKDPGYSVIDCFNYSNYFELLSGSANNDGGWMELLIDAKKMPNLVIGQALNYLFKANLSNICDYQINHSVRVILNCMDIISTNPELNEKFYLLYSKITDNKKLKNISIFKEFIINAEYDKMNNSINTINDYTNSSKIKI